MAEYPSNLAIENEEDLAELAEEAFRKRLLTLGDPQAKNNRRAGQAGTALLAYYEKYDRGEPLETVLRDLLCDLRHLADSLVDDNGDRGADFDYANERAGEYYQNERETGDAI